MIYGISFLILITLLYLWYVYGGSFLPSNIDELIAEKLKEEPVELIFGETGYANNNGLKIFYERRVVNDSKGTFLLINGHSQKLTNWPNYFVNELLDRGFDVVKFDNRELGFSDTVDNYDQENPYLLQDMATDAIAVLDHLGLDKVHLVGASMGGMIAQILAINCPERLHSLTSVMSTGNFVEKDDPAVSLKFKIGYHRLTQRYGKSLDKIENSIKYSVGVMKLLEGSGDYEYDIPIAIDKSIYEIKKRNGSNRIAVTRQTRAIFKSGSRLEELKSINIPTLVIHGKDDCLIAFSHGERYADIIPNAQKLFITGLGHDMPELFIPLIMKEMDVLIERVGLSYN